MELLRQMDLLSYLAQRTGAGAEELAQALGVSVPTIKRDVSACRHLGALIISDRQYGYRLMNWESIRGNVRRWRDLERKGERWLERGL
jgi:predicted DNA-binding transcriptional regulator YafY